MPQNDSKGIPSFREFVDSLSSAKHSQFATRAVSKVENEAAFDEMRQHLISRYTGVESANSFVDENGQVFDCIPIEQQPSLKGTRATIAKPTDIPFGVPTPRSIEHTLVQPQLGAESKDSFGNVKRCPEGSIAVRRVTMEELSRFKNLRDFFRKEPIGGARIASGGRAVTDNHRYAHATQGAASLGSHTILNIWKPPVGAGQFSLSQLWLAGGSPVQTIESGWQVFPQKYGSDNPSLFIYFTADGYQSTGAYNLDGPGFVQTNNSWTLGGSLTNLSVTDGAQTEIELAWYLFSGNWWLYINGNSAANTVGYYPATLYGSGQLATNSTDIDFGGETYSPGATYPPMGSCVHANQGFRKAAYHRCITYFPPGGGVQAGSLTGHQNTPACYTIQVGNAADPWNSYFFYGGPGGSC